MRIYIADDSLEFAKLCERVAIKKGWVATLCGNGRELLDKLREESGPAFLLVDISMPEMDGIETIEGLTSVGRPLRIRFITGGNESAALAARMIADARDLNVGRFLTKPITIDELRKVLAEEAEILRSLSEL